jgi:hypothetical protein
MTHSSNKADKVNEDARLIQDVGLYYTFILLGAIYMILVVGAAQFLQSAPRGIHRRDGSLPPAKHGSALFTNSRCPRRCAHANGTCFGVCSF